jgi:hypothetical protein
VKKLQYISEVQCDKNGLNGVLEIKSGLQSMLQDSLNETFVLYSTSSVQGHDVFGYNFNACKIASRCPWVNFFNLHT